MSRSLVLIVPVENILSELGRALSNYSPRQLSIDDNGIYYSKGNPDGYVRVTDYGHDAEFVDDYMTDTEVSETQKTVVARSRFLSISFDCEDLCIEVLGVLHGITDEALVDTTNGRILTLGSVVRKKTLRDS